MILWRAHIRHLRRHPWQLVLALIGIAVGVAVVVAVDLANSSAERAFTLSDETLSGRATHEIVAAPGGIDENVFTRLRLEVGVRDSAPVVQGYVTTPEFPGRTFTLLGIAPLAESPFRDYSASATTDNVLEQLVTRPATALMLQQTAAALGLKPGASIDIETTKGRRSLDIIGFMDSDDRFTRQVLDTVIVVDIATAQELLGMVGRLSRIDLIIAPSDHATLAHIRQVLPPGAQLLPARSDTDAMAQMTRAFRLNLSAMSLLALMVGTFLIYNTMSFAVLQRRTQIGTLRALGVTRREILRLVVGEAVILGGAGTSLGIVLGILLGEGLLQLVTRTIDDLYFVMTVSRLDIAPWTLTKGLALGMGAAIIAAVKPAREATAAPPRAVLSRSVIESQTRRMVPLAAIIGGAIIAIGLALLLLPSRSLVLGFTGLFAMILGSALLAPAFTVIVMTLARPVLGRAFGMLGRMSARGVITSLSRTGVAIAALTVAVATTVGVGIMIDSLRHTVTHWLQNTLRADIYVSLPDDAQTAGATLDQTLRRKLANLPGVAAVSAGRQVALHTGQGFSRILIMDLPKRGFDGFDFKQGDAVTAWRAFTSGQVLVSEPYAYRHGLGLGDNLTLPSDQGPRNFTVAGVFYSYESDQGVVAMSRDTYTRYWRDPGVTGLGVYAAAGADLKALNEAVRGAVAPRPLLVRSNRALRQASMEVFDRTFQVTQVLRLLAVLVAFIGILSALMAMQLERAREIAVLRAYGLTPRQVWALLTTETGLMGLTTGLLAIPLGLGLALILILVINRRSFGWSMLINIDPTVLFQALALAVVSAVLAGIYPALHMARTPPALALRDE